MNRSEPLYLRHAYNDLARNKGVSIALALVLILGAFLMATGSMVMERLVGSVDQLFEEAQPPHFLQMHTGDYDPAALEDFAAQNAQIESWLVEEMLGFDGAAVSWDRPSTGESGDFSDSLIDNLFVTQNEEFDFLLDGTGAIPRPSAGEVYVPVAYQQRYGLETGDELSVMTDAGSVELRVEGFVRDSQMASSLSSATRFLVSEADFSALERAGGATPEIIAEYRLHDPSAVSEFQRAYESDDAMPKNGPAVTIEQIRLINAFSDGLLAVALMFGSLLLIAIALLSVRFVIRATLEDDVREIGAMKAVGIPDKAISRLYLAKYGAMALLACVVGGGLAVAATRLLTQSFEANYIAAPPGAAMLLVPVAALVCVFVFVVAVCRGVLGKVKRIQVVDALVHGSVGTGRRAGPRPSRLRRSGLASLGGGGINRRLMLLELRAEKGQWILLPIVFFLASVLMILPTNLLSTFADPRFVEYMGVPESDVRVDIQFSEDVDAMQADVLARMRADDRLRDVRTFAQVLTEAEDAEGPATLRVQVGDHADGAIAYLQGGAPGRGEIALSVLNADRYQVSVGDELTVRSGGEPATLAVSGVYQDVTSGGYTAKMQGRATGGAAAYVVYAHAAEGVDPAAVAADYSARFPGAVVIPTREYVEQTMSYVTDAFRGAAVLSSVFGIGVALLITGLFLRLVLSRDRRKIGLLSAVGFSSGEIIGQVREKVLVTATAGTVLGLAFAITLGEDLVGALIAAAGLGIADLEFIPNPLLAYVAYPIALVGAGLVAVALLTARLRGADKSSWLER